MQKLNELEALAGRYVAMKFAQGVRAAIASHLRAGKKNV